jgi:hypothetical protein
MKGMGYGRPLFDSFTTVLKENETQKDWLGKPVVILDEGRSRTKRLVKRLNWPPKVKKFFNGKVGWS